VHAGLTRCSASASPCVLRHPLCSLPSFSLCDSGQSTRTGLPAPALPHPRARVPAPVSSALRRPAPSRTRTSGRRVPSFPRARAHRSPTRWLRRPAFLGAHLCAWPQRNLQSSRDLLGTSSFQVRSVFPHAVRDWRSKPSHLQLSLAQRPSQLIPPPSFPLLRPAPSPTPSRLSPPSRQQPPILRPI